MSLGGPLGQTDLVFVGDELRASRLWLRGQLRLARLGRLLGQTPHSARRLPALEAHLGPDEHLSALNLSLRHFREMLGLHLERDERKKE